MRMFRAVPLALAAISSVSLFALPAQAQRQPDYSVSPRDDYRRDDRDDARFAGTWQTVRRVTEDGSDGVLRYNLYLRRDGRAEMVTTRRGELRRSRYVDDTYGSLLSVYLNRSDRVAHTGTWSADGDNLTVRLRDIDGRQDNATFTGTWRRGTLRLATRNTGMYGRGVRFDLRRDEGGAPSDRENDRDRLDRDGDTYYDNDSRQNRPRDYDTNRDNGWSGPSRPDRAPNHPDRDPNRRDVLTWQGSVDDAAILYIKQDNVRVESSNDKAVQSIQSRVLRRLPQRAVRVEVADYEGRGRVEIMEQPTSRNNYTAVLRVTDPGDGRGDHRFTLTYRE